MVYDIPLINDDFKNEVFYMKRAIEHNDSVARELILAGREPTEERWIFIGDGKTVRWLKITPTTEEVIEL
ncbi:MAG: hypothetical protein QQN63_10225 [Nitrosopumilus sp.]